MDEFLSTRQVIEILGVDRITIYRMLQDGRLKGIKIGQQWRFTRREVERLVTGQTTDDEPAQLGESGFPTHCVQTIQDLYTGISGLSAVVVDHQGNPLTDPTFSCQLCPLFLSSSSGALACQASWKAIAGQPQSPQTPLTCHAGVNYAVVPIGDASQPIGAFITGGFYWQAPDPCEEKERLSGLSRRHGIPLEQLEEAVRTLPVIEKNRRSVVEAWPVAAARAIQSILNERSGFIQRLQRIADLTQLS